MIELVGRSDSDWAGDSATRKSITGCHCNVQGSHVVQQEPETDSHQSQFLRSRVLRSQCLRRRTVGSRRTLQRTSLQSFSSSRNSSRKGFRFGTSQSPEKGTGGGLQHIEIRCLAVQQWIRGKHLSAGCLDTKSNTADLSTKFLDGPRTQSLSRKLGQHVTGGTDD